MELSNLLRSMVSVFERLEVPYLETWVRQLGLTEVWNEIRERLR